MKKGKPNVPANMRSQYKRQQEMGRMKNEMMAAQRPGSDGFPVFNLFVRTTRANVSEQKSIAMWRKSRRIISFFRIHVWKISHKIYF